MRTPTLPDVPDISRRVDFGFPKLRARRRSAPEERGAYAAGAIFERAAQRAHAAVGAQGSEDGDEIEPRDVDQAVLDGVGERVDGGLDLVHEERDLDGA